MNTSAHLSRSCLVSLLLIAPIIGCHDERPRSKASASSATKQGASKQSATSERDEPPAGNVKRVQLSPGVWIENDGKKRRVVVNTAVCLREGDYGLECLLCRKQTKEHESVVAVRAWLDQVQAHWDEQLKAFKAHVEREGGR